MILSCVYAVFIVTLGLVIYISDVVLVNTSMAEVFFYTQNLSFDLNQLISRCLAYTWWCWVWCGSSSCTTTSAGTWTRARPSRRPFIIGGRPTARIWSAARPPSAVPRFLQQPPQKKGCSGVEKQAALCRTIASIKAATREVSTSRLAQQVREFYIIYRSLGARRIFFLGAPPELPEYHFPLTLFILFAHNASLFCAIDLCRFFCHFLVNLCIAHGKTV